MPYKFDTEKLKIPRKYDKRVKLTEEDRKEIKRLYFKEKIAVRAIARVFKDKCSRSLIRFIVMPEKLEKANRLHAIRRKDKR